MIRFSALILLVAQFVVSGQVFAQISEPVPVMAEMSKGKANGWQVYIPSATEKDAENAWRKLCKGFNARPDRVRKTQDHLAENVLIPALSLDTFNLYAQFKEDEAGAYITSFVEFRGSFLNNHQFKKESAIWVEMLRDMANRTAREIYEDRLRDAEKELSQRNKELEKLYKEKEGYEKDIRDCEKTIAERRTQIEQNSKEQLKSKEGIKEQEILVDKAKNELRKFPE
ncbi:MAG: hypothetical protein H6606_03615 [Flavobacteriales bacterium]|nr:hypothetical protein [Flavobacteriales bacterium]